eukprot:401757_1
MRNIRKLLVYELYDKALSRRPILTKMITSGSVLMVTDPTAQYLEFKYKQKQNNINTTTKMKWNKKRTLKMVLGYTLITTPLFHASYKYFLDKYFPTMAYRMVFKKVLLETFTTAPIHLSCFMAFGVIFDGGSKQMIIQKYKQDLWKVWCLGASFIPILQIINFRYLPQRYRVLYLIGISVVWSMIMSFFVNKEIKANKNMNRISVVDA